MKLLITFILFIIFCKNLVANDINIVVGFYDKDEDEIRRVEKSFSLKRVNLSKNLPIGFYYTNEAVDEKIRALERDPYVRYAEKSLDNKLNESPSPHPNQYYLSNTGQLAGTKGIDVNWLECIEYLNKYPSPGEVIIAVVDDGLYWAPDSEIDSSILAFNTNDYPLNGLDDDDNGYIDDYLGWDFAQNDNEVFPENNNLTHGTKVASLITTSIQYNGMPGIATGYNVKLLPIKIYETDENGEHKSTGSPALAFEYAYEMGACIINYSSINSGSKSFQDMIDFLELQNVLIVCGSGNDNKNLNSSYALKYPSYYPNTNIISVGGIDNRGNPYYTYDNGTNYGSGIVDVLAPAEDIYVYNPFNSTEGTIIDFDLSDTSFWTSGSLIGNESYKSWGISNNISNGYWIHSGTFQTYSYNNSTKYDPNTDTFLVSDWINLKGSRNTQFQFNIWGELENYFDKLYIEVSVDGSNFDQLGSHFTGKYDTFTTETLNLSDFDGSRIKLRFRLKTDGYVEKKGIIIKSPKINGLNNYQIRNGTSFAAPIVTGICGLMKSINFNLTPTEIRKILINTSNTLPLYSKNGIYDSYFDSNANGVLDINGEYDERDGAEVFVDALNGIWDPGEAFYDALNGEYDLGEVFVDANSNGQYDVGEVFVDALNGVYDEGEEFTDELNGEYDPGEDFTDEAKVISGGYVNAYKALHSVFNKVEAYSSEDLENWSLIEDCFNETLFSNYSHHDYDEFRVEIESVELNQQDLSKACNLRLNAKDTINDTIVSLTQKLDLSNSTNVFIKIEID